MDLSLSSSEFRIQPNKYCSKKRTEENHFQWRIENFQEASAPLFILDSAKLTVVVGETFGLKTKLTFRLQFDEDDLQQGLPHHQQLLRPLPHQNARQQQPPPHQNAQQQQPPPRQNVQQPPPHHNVQQPPPHQNVQQQPDQQNIQQQQPAPSVQRAPLRTASKLRLVCEFEDYNKNSLPYLSKRLHVFLKKRMNDDFYFDSDLKPEAETPKGWRLSNIIQVYPVLDAALVDDALRIKIMVTLCRRFEEPIYDFGTTNISTVVSDVISMEHSYADTVTLWCSGDSDDDDEISISSSKAVLSARSASMAGMFQRNPTLTKIKLDTSPRIFKILLRYLHTGNLPVESFSSSSEILGVASLSQNYGLHELFDYCDEVLADFCTMKTASRLMCEASEFRLFKSFRAIMEYITRHGGQIGSDGKPRMEGNEKESKDSGKESGETIPGIMKHNYTLNEIITTGVLKKVCQFEWEVRNFLPDITTRRPNTVRFFNSHIIGSVFNSEGLWKLETYLGGADINNKIRISVECRLKSEALPPEEVKNVFYCVLVEPETPHKNGQIFGTLATPIGQYSSGAAFFEKDGAALGNDSGNLYLKLRVVILANDERNKHTFKACKVFRSLQKDATMKLQNDMESLYKSHPAFTDVTIVSKEGYETYAHWRFLAAHCQTFKSMFESGMEERQSGVIKLKDMPHNAIDIMLYFLYTGRIPRNKFATAADIIDVAEVADKYDLAELHRYCDEALTEKFNGNNDATLLTVATKYRLTKAQSVIRNYMISRSARDAIDHSEELFAVSYSLCSNVFVKDAQ